MKKRIVLMILVCILASMAVFAANNQTIYSVDDSVFKEIETLYISQGFGSPSSSGPWTGNELLHMMEKIDRSSLSKTLAAVYDNIMKKLNVKPTLDYDTVAFKFSLDVNPEVYLRSMGVKDGQTTSDSYKKIGSLLGEAGVLLTSALKHESVDLSIAYKDLKEYNEHISSKDAALIKYFSSYGLKVDDLKFDELVEEKFALNPENEEYLTQVGAKLQTLNQLYTTDCDLEAFGATTDALCQEAQWFHGYLDRKPLLKFTTEIWALDNFYGYFGLGLGDTDFGYLYALKFNTNLTLIAGVPGKSGDDAFDAGLGKRFGSSNIFGEPMKAVVSVGGDRWNVMAGRDRLSWGNGQTGNLMLSDSFPQHSFAKFTTYHNVFKYSLLGTIYPYYSSFEYNDDDHVRTSTQTRDASIIGQWQFIDGYKSLIAHRLEGSFWKNRINIAVTEACMFKVEKNDGFKLAMINPFGFMHNEYVRTNGNSLLVFEGDFTPIKGINLYGQFALDDFALPGESDNIVPAASGIMAGVKGAYDFGPVFLKFGAEYVKTDPFLYLRGQYEDVAKNNYGSESQYSYGHGFDAIYKHFAVEQGIYVENKFITYTYGNDVKIAQAKIAVEMPNVFEAGFGFFKMSSGVMNIDSPWGTYSGDINKYLTKPKTPSTEDPFAGTKGEVESETVFTLTGTYHTPIKNLDVYGYVDFITFKNYNNIKGVTFKDIQSTLGVSYSI